MAQPELRFQPFDWVQYRQTGQVNSISFSDIYAYVGTQFGGVQRLNLYTNRFEEPITRAQGLRSNSVTAVHYGSDNVLWIATPKGLEFSYTAEGDWRYVSRNELGIQFGAMIERIGESDNAIWLTVQGLVYRLDNLTGVVTGMMPVPDVIVKWSSGLAQFRMDISKIMFDYTVLDGWMTDLNNLYHPNGRQIRITTQTQNRMNEIWFGTSNGTIFRGDPTMKTLTPLQFGMGHYDVQAIGGDNSFWLGGLLNDNSGGVTFFDSKGGIADIYVFQDHINMDQISVSAILELKKEVWFAGDHGILVYDKKQDYWRTYGLRSGSKKNLITAMVEFNEQVWLSSQNGLIIMNQKNKEEMNHNVAEYFKNIYIYDLSFANGLFFIGTQSGLFIYDEKNEKIYDGESFGYKTKEFIFPQRHDGFTAFAQYKGDLYAANKTGIVQFNFRERQWSNAVDASIFGGLEVRELAVYKNILFISTVNGILQYDMKKHSVDVLNYPFIGAVNDMYICGRELWLGTSEGLISYLYR